MKASVLTIGDEILRGRTVDSNFSYIAKKLFNIGIQLGHHRVVGDIKSDIVKALSELSSESDLVFITGGLGPTPDDLTRYAIADYLEQPVIIDNIELEKMRKRFEKRNIPMAPSNRTQVEFPFGVKPFYNPVGMAPGMYFEIENTRFWALPGVPREMKAMMAEIIDGLDEGEAMDKIILRTTGIPESVLYDKLKTSVIGKDDVIGYYPSLSGVDIVIRGKDADLIAAKIIQELDGFLYSRIENETIQQVLQNKLTDYNITLSTAESCTGGMIASSIVDNPGSSEFFAGSIVAYSNEAKMDLLDIDSDLLIDHGAVSPEVAKQMAINARGKFDTDIALSVTGIAGPGGGTEEKPVGLVYIAMDTSNGTYCRKYKFSNDRDVTRNRSMFAALFILWLYINKKLDGFTFLDGSELV